MARRRRRTTKRTTKRAKGLTVAKKKTARKAIATLKRTLKL